MPLVKLLIILIIVGVILWLINKYAPKKGNARKVLTVVVIIVVALWLLYAFGIISNLSGIRIGR